jgi:hypothetical protein
MLTSAIHPIADVALFEEHGKAAGLLPERRQIAPECLTLGAKLTFGGLSMYVRNGSKADIPGYPTLLMSGPPGSGKSLMAACLSGILPELTAAEALEISMVVGVAGTLEGGNEPMSLRASG